jgi:hypothetical protein
MCYGETMLITNPDVASLDGLLSWWERVEYVAEGFVILGCVGEFMAEFTGIRTPEWRHQLSKVSLLVLIAALAFELGALGRTNSLSGQEIALLNGKAKEFDSKIAEAQRGTAEAQRDAEIARQDASRLNTRAGKLEKEAADARNDTEKLHQQNLATEAKLESERGKRLELEKTEAPRYIWYEARGKASNIDTLKQFAGMAVSIESIRDAEAQRAARNLGNRFKQAGWIVIGDTVFAKDDIPDGVTVDQFQASEDVESGPIENGFAKEWRSSAVVDEIVAFLQANDWKAYHGWAAHGELQSNEIRIRVGFKPAPYFLPGVFKNAPNMQSKRVAEIKKEIENLKMEDLDNPAPKK